MAYYMCRALRFFCIMAMISNVTLLYVIIIFKFFLTYITVCYYLFSSSAKTIISFFSIINCFCIIFLRSASIRNGTPIDFKYLVYFEIILIRHHNIKKRILVNFFVWYKFTKRKKTGRGINITIIFWCYYSKRANSLITVR